jgi:hypothetical protein
VTSRPLDWAPLADADPVPGDVDQIQDIARRHGALAEELRTQADMLQRLSQAEGWDADAGRRFASTAAEISTDLNKARRRYTAVEQALRQYVPELTEAQREADAALEDAKAAHTLISALRPTSSTPDGSSSPSPTPSPGTSPVDAGEARVLSDAQAAMLQAGRRLAEAVRRRDEAGRRAAVRIRDVAGHDGLKDSWWDRVKGWSADRWDSFIGWVHEHAATLGTIANACGWIATALAAVAIAVSFIPMIGLLVAGPLLTVATAFTVVSLACHVLLALSGDGSWVDAGFDLVGVATFGYGRIASKGAEAAEETLKVTATRTARKEGEKEARRTLGTARPGGRRLSPAQRRVLDKQARKAAKRHARETMEKAAAAKASVRSKALNLDGLAAGQEARILAMARIAPNSARAQAAVQAARSSLRKAAIASAIGVTIDGVDKSGVANSIKPPLTFGRYASR